MNTIGKKQVYKVTCSSCNVKENNKMSYDIELRENDKIVVVTPFEEGGTYVLGGSTEGHLNITYNYSWFYYKTIDTTLGIRWLHGKSGKQTIERLENAIAILGTNKDTDYWNATPGNAGYALSILLNWAKQYPDAIFEGE